MAGRRVRGALLSPAGRARPGISPARQAAALVLLRLAGAGLHLIEALLRSRLIGWATVRRRLGLLRPLVALSQRLLAR
jgi:hypothetical protein